MPYAITRRIHDGRIEYAVLNKESGKTYGWTTKEKAEAQRRLLYFVEFSKGK
jgi:hypothetical protein